MELTAARWLESQGAQILEQQYRSHHGEIDLIYQEAGQLVFGEVKFRTTERYGSPAEAVDLRKRQRLVYTAETYMMQHGLRDVPVRFDVIEMTEQDGQLYIRVLRDAFRPGE
jgi:putative endonuclease